jgi:hypothetical protein
MTYDGQFPDVAGLAVRQAGGLRETGDPWMPFELVDADGGVVVEYARVRGHAAPRERRVGATRGRTS